MPANPTVEETALVEAAIAWLQGELPSTWKIQSSSRTIANPDPNRPPFQVDALIELQAPQGGGATIVVEAKRSFTPRDAEQLFLGPVRRYRALTPNLNILVVAPWLSSRTQQVLAENGINFLDQTGNVRIAIEYPPLFVSSRGANQDPAPVARGKARVRGPKAGRLIRFLVDVSPPYGVTQIAGATGLAPGYVSRLLETLSEEGLVERIKRGKVISTDYPGLLRRWSQSYDVFRTNQSSSFVAPNGATALLQDLAGLSVGTSLVVTGSFAAVRIAPVAAPALLLAYCNDIQSVVTQCGLLPADRGANVILLDPFDSVVWERTTRDDATKYAAPSQVAIDCLTGNGRMPSEGEAVLAWMEDSESRWRLPPLERTGATETVL
jgi:DNA-binding transcriptional ArsR family regulator